MTIRKPINLQYICEDAPIVATSSGGNAAYTQVYVLADDNGILLIKIIQELSLLLH